MYDGVSEPLETFLAHFDNFASHFHWEEDERLFNLHNSLKKSVGNVLWDSGSPASSGELIALLRSRYGMENQADWFRMELKAWQCEKGEPLQAVFQDFKRLMALAFSGQAGAMAKITAIDAFVDALQNRDLRKQVLQKTPATLAEAFTWAVRIEAIDDSGSHDAPVRPEQDGHRKEHTFTHAAATETPPEDPCVELAHLWASLRKHQVQLAQWTGGPPPLWGSYHPWRPRRLHC